MEENANIDDSMSRLDAKIRRKQLIADNLDQLWDSVWSAVEKTRGKLNDHYSAQLTAMLDNEKTVINVGAPFNPISREKPSIEIRFKRDERKLVMRYTSNPDMEQCWENPVSFTVAVCEDIKSLCLKEGKKMFTPIQLAERLLAEKIAKLDLDD